MRQKSNIHEKAILKASPPDKLQKFNLRLMVAGAFFWMIIFIWWFFSTPREGSAWLYWPLTLAFIIKLMRMGYEWYHYFDISVPKKPNLKKQFTVDVLTTACPGEPHSMIINTLKKIVAIKYPHTSYLCDEGNDPALKKVCEELGVVHVTRKIKKNAKAGNVNNALRQATGELCVIMDPDHEPVPEFLDRVLPYFEDAEVGYVQVVQGYYNQYEGFVARAAAEQTYHFYGPMMMGMNSYGTSQAIGANCTFRRAALDSIGGHAAGLTEDMHTSMKLQAKGWKAVYVPEMLSKGLVPSTVSAFYKQQLKWSRGTFELFFEVLPGLLKNLSWRQRFHHLMSPLYYLSGVVSLINILIPVLALFSGLTPWKVDIETFVLFYAPLVIMTLLIRQYTQRWLMEERERGLHIEGGLLQLGTWWVYVVGLIYSIFRIKVPYIPTPKEGNVENNVKLVLPNIIAALVSLAAILYGISEDYNQYTLLMAAFALTNAISLGYFSLIVQQKFMHQLQSGIQRIINEPFRVTLNRFIWNLEHKFYFLLRKSALFLAAVMIFSLLSYTMHKPESTNVTATQVHKKVGGFYKGVYLPVNDKEISLRALNEWERKTGNKTHIISFYQAWGPESIENFPDIMLNKLIREKGIIPMITWEPWSSTFPEFKEDFNLATDRKVMRAITKGRFDDYLKAYCDKIKSLQGPVFIRFAHEPDNPQYPWSLSGANTAEEFKEAHRYVVNFFAENAVGNVAWVWNPWDYRDLEKYYPGDDFVDWIGITGLNYGLASADQEWKSFSELYEPFREKILSYNKPVMISEFGSTCYGGNQDKWIRKALSDISEHFKEIKSLTFFYSNRDKNWVNSWRPKNSDGFIDWTFKNEQRTFPSIHEAFEEAPFSQEPVIKKKKSEPVVNYTSRLFWKKDRLGSHWLVNGNPFYMKGVAYNTGQDWQDGNVPLTHHQLMEDFAGIREMGANTIRRYSAGIYDENILNAARQNNLKVLYGFWLDAKVDYYDDSTQLAEYASEIENKVIRYKDDTTVFAWCLGNETWGLLKHSFSQPYLSKVRHSYILFLEELAEKIHSLDSLHPVITAVEHTKELPAELQELHTYVPAIDAVGVNSYYLENIRELDSIAGVYYPGKPYLVSEFGPKGYWNPYLSKLKNDSILEEEGDREKGAYYAMQWKNFIEGKKKNNLGGCAFCWHDRLEGTATWFGITDYKGRRKPLYYALKEVWTGTKQKSPITPFDIEWEEDSLVPGAYAAFKVKMYHKPSGSYQYEWFLRKETSMEDFPGYIRQFNNGKRIFMKIPDEPGMYRLYLYINDGQGNVSTISHPIPVENKSSVPLS